MKMQANAGLELLTTAEARRLPAAQGAQALPGSGCSHVPTWTAGFSPGCSAPTARYPSRADRRRQPRSAPAVDVEREPGGTRLSAEGSEAGFQRFRKGEVVAGAIHFHDLGNPDADANPERLVKERALLDTGLIGFAVRERGLIVAAGNPLHLGSPREAHDRRRRRPAAPARSVAQGRPVDRRAPGYACRADRGGHRPSHPRGPRRFRDHHARGRDGGGARFRPALHWALRLGCAPARLLPSSLSGAPRAVARAALCRAGTGAGLARRERDRQRALGAVICPRCLFLVNQRRQFDPLAR